MKAKLVKEYLNEGNPPVAAPAAPAAAPVKPAAPAAPAPAAPKIPLPDQAKWDALIGHLVQINALLKQAPAAPAKPAKPAPAAPVAPVK